MKSGVILNFPTKQVTVSTEDLLKLELRRAQTEVLMASPRTAERKRLIEECNKAVAKLQEFYDKSVKAQIIKHPALRRKEKIKTLQVAMLTIMVKMQEFIHNNDFENPEFLKLSNQKAQLEAKIEMIQSAPLRAIGKG